jgi:hypothetical protein
MVNENVKLSKFTLYLSTQYVKFTFVMANA